jgi:hypothetical protein
MKSILDRYLDRVLIYVHKSAPASAAIRQELRDHLLQKVDDLIAAGLPHEEALLEALRHHGAPHVIGYGLRDPFPWLDIRTRGTACGVIAIGPRAIGIVAFGGIATGVVACGTVAIGLFSAGLLALGFVFAWGALGIGGIVFAGIAIGIVADGGIALGLVAGDGLAAGLWVPYADRAASYYSGANVPPLLKSLGACLHALSFTFFRHFAAILMIFFPGISALNLVLAREGKRVSPQDDWLVDS